MSVSILQLLSKQFFIFIKNYRLFIILNVWIIDKNYIFSKEFSNKIAKSNFSCFLWVDINVTNNCVKWSHDIISYWSQAPVTTRKHIVTDFVISANIVSSIKESIWYRIVMKLSIFTHVSHKDYTANGLVSDAVFERSPKPVNLLTLITAVVSVSRFTVIFIFSFWRVGWMRRCRPQN